MADAIKLAIVISAAFRGSDAFDKAGGGLKGLKKALSKVRAEIGLLAGLAAFNFLKEGFATFVQFEQRMAEAGSIVGATREEIAGFSDAVRDMTKEMPQTADELGAGLYDVFSAGVTDSSDAMKTLRLSAKAAVAGLTDTATAVKAGVSTMNAFGLSMEDLEHIYDVQFLTVKRGILRFGELTAEIGKIAPSAKAAGQSMENMFGTLAFLTTKGLSAAEAGTALGRAYDALTQPVTIKKFRELGIAVADLSDETMRTDPVLVGMRQAIVGAEEAVKNITEVTNEATVVYEEQTAELNQLAAQYAETQAAMSEFGDEMAGISLEQKRNRLEISKIRQQADRESRELTDEEIARIDEISEKNDELQLTYAELSIAQTELGMTAKEQAKAVDKASKSQAEAEKDVAAFAEQQTAATEALEKANAAYDTQIAQTGKFRPLVDIVADLNAEMEGMSEIAKAQVIAQLFPQIRARKAIMGIMGDTAALTANINEMTDASQSAGSMQEAFAVNVDTTANDIQLMTNAVQDLQISISQDLLPVVQQFMELLKPLITFVSENTEVLWALVAAFVAYKVGMVIATISTWGFNAALLANPITWIILLIVALVLALIWMATHWDETKEAFVRFAEVINGVFRAAWDAIVGAFNWLVDALGNIGNILGDVADSISNFFMGIINSALQWGKDMISMFIQGIKDSIAGLGNIMGDVWDTVSGWISFDMRANDEELKGWGYDAIKFFAEGMQNAMPEIGMSAELLNANLQTGLINGDAVPGVGAGVAETGSTTDSHDVYEITIPVENIEEGMDMKKFSDDLGEEMSRQKKTQGGG